MNPNVNQVMCVNFAIIMESAINPTKSHSFVGSVAIFLWFSYGFPIGASLFAPRPQVAFLQRMIQLHHLPEASKRWWYHRGGLRENFNRTPPHISGLKPGFSYRFSQATMVFGIDFPLNQSNDRCEVDSAFVDD